MSHEFNIEGRDLTEGWQKCSRAVEVRILVIPSVVSLTGNVHAFIYVHSSVCLVLVSSLNVTEIWSATSTKTSRNLLEKLFISKINPNYTAIYWHWFPNIHCAFCYVSYFIHCCCLRFSPLGCSFFLSSFLFFIFTHGVAVGQMHRTVKIQQRELPFPKYQVYNL